MKFIMKLCIVVLALAAPSVAQAATVPVTQLTGDFAATNSSVAETGDGVQFGPYANGGTAVGSLYYAGANGLTLSQINALSFTESHNTSDDSPIAAPYLRIFLNGDADDAVFDSTACATTSLPENEPNHQDMVAGTPSGTIRYDDDGCGPEAVQLTWAQLVAAHGDEVISGIYITVGATGGADLSALVTDLTVNDTTFCFTCQPTPPPTAISSLVVQPQTIVQAPPVIITPGQQCHGNELRHVHAPRRAGEHFLSVRATLRGKKLATNGRTVTADLNRMPEGNYNVHLTSKYLTRHGHTRTVKTTRNLSVVCA